MLSVQRSNESQFGSRFGKAHYREPTDETVANTFHVHCLKKHFPEWFKVAELAAVQVLGSVEDERTFSTVTFSKSKLRNRLSEHLAACVGIYSQKFFTLETFPFDKVYSEWHEDQKRQPDC
jgi:TorA maturation chaperone TorD